MVCLLAAWSLSIWITGGVKYELLGLRMSSTSSLRPLLAALIGLAVYVWQWRDALLDDIRAIAQPRSAHAVAIAAAMAVFSVTTWRGVTVAGSADAYGYVSEASLVRHGSLVLPVDTVDQAPWPDAIWTFAPLGYRPLLPAHDRLVPTYAAGLPVAMALLQFVFGYSGAFLLVPLCGAAAVWLTFLLARRLFGSSSIGAAAAVLVATSPAFLFQAFWPMSDVPAATAWTAALVLFVYDQPLAAGLAMSAALAIRPNLLLLPALTLVWTAARDYRNREIFGRTFRASLGLLPAIAGIAILQWRVYGSPFESGYGNLGSLFSFDYATTNIVAYSTWLLQTQTPLALIGLAVFVAPRWCVARVPFPRLFFAATLVATFASYLFYMPYGVWWYLRFLLPAWPLGLSLLAGGSDGLLRRFAPRLRTAGLVLLVAISAINGLWFARDKHLLDMGRSERRYVDVARFVDQHTERNAVIFSMQHSGSIRQYAGRLTLRYDALPPDWLDRAAAYLESIGRHPYLVLEAWEVEAFTHRFAGRNALASLDWAPLGKLRGWNDVAIYDLGAARSRGVTMAIPTFEIDRAAGWPVPPPHPAFSTVTGPGVPQSPTRAADRVRFAAGG